MCHASYKKTYTIKDASPAGRCAGYILRVARPRGNEYRRSFREAGLHDGTQRIRVHIINHTLLYESTCKWAGPPCSGEVVSIAGESCGAQDVCRQADETSIFEGLTVRRAAWSVVKRTS